MMRRFGFTAVFAFLAGCASVHQTEHTGFHFQGDLGAGGAQSTASQSGWEGKYSGAAGLVSVAAGGAVLPNLIVGGQFWGSSTPDPDRTVNGQTETMNDWTLGTFGFGPMVKYYFMPVNVYVAATPSIAQLQMSDQDNNTDETKWGPALRLAAGKEWYASYSWGLGVAGVLHLARNEARSGGPTWSTIGGGVVFTASFM